MKKAAAHFHGNLTAFQDFISIAYGKSALGIGKQLPQPSILVVNISYIDRIPYALFQLKDRHSLILRKEYPSCFITLSHLVGDIA